MAYRLLREFRQASTRLDTPPFSNRRHPASAIAPSSCGNTEDRIDSDIKAKFRELIEIYYLADDPEAVSNAYLLAKTDWEEAYQHLSTEQQPKIPALSFAYVVAREVDLFTRDFCREGKSIATQKYGPVDDGPVAVRHNEAWEMDHTTLDVIVIDEETGLPIGRPTITVAIDRHSRAIPAFHVSWDAPGIHCVIECLRKGINLKDDLLEPFPTIRNPWPVFGVPDEIITDNAQEFRSKALNEICSRLGIEHSRSPVLKPWYRGRIERAIKTLVYSTCHTVPGTTYANIFQRSKARVPEKVAVCTLPQLEEIITRFIVDVYHVRRHRTLNNAPIQVFHESVARNGMKPLPDPKKLAVILSPFYFRKVHPKGIVFEDLWYSSPQLSLYLALPNVPKIVSVKVDPNDLTRVWYFDSSINEHVECRIQKSMRDKIQDVTLDLHKMARCIQRSNPDLLAGEAGLAKSYALIRRALEERVRGRDGLTNKRRAIRTLAKLREKAAAMFEDAPALDTSGEDEVADDLFGPEDVTPEHDEVDPANATEAPAANAVAKKEPTKPRKPRAKAAEPKQASAEPEPRLQIAPTDDMDDLDKAMQANLFVNRSRENNNV